MEAKNIQHDSVAQVAKRLGMKPDAAWNLFIDSGINFLEVLQMRVRRKRTFDLQFRFMIDKTDIGDTPLATFFKTVQAAPGYWDWWASQMYFATRPGNGVTNAATLAEVLNTIDITIPGFILNKIFYGKQKQTSEGRIVALPENEAQAVGSKSKRTGASVGSGVQH